MIELLSLKEEHSGRIVELSLNGSGFDLGVAAPRFPRVAQQ